MTQETWLGWPSREALSRVGLTRARRNLAWGIRALVFGALLWSTFSKDRAAGGWAWVAGFGLVVGCVLLARVFFRLTYEHRLWPSVASLLLVMGAAAGARAAGWPVLALVLWCGCAVTALERLPLAAAVPCTAVALGAYTVAGDDNWLTAAVTVAGLGLAGYVLRLDAEARGTAQRLLAQERAARAAEAESAALDERARIAREIHDVLAHSLSAQLVHLEAARLLIEREPPGEFRDTVLERVVAARGMAREGLAETRQALSALRGEMSPVEDFLHTLIEGPGAGDGLAAGARVQVEGERRPLRAEASQTVRRVAQEALTNVRKHAPGAAVAVRLEYLADEVALEVRDSGARERAGELTVSGCGYGLLGMRERAELLGGTLEAGPEEEGFVVRLRVPA
ncbi:Sensor histidine kinase DesK [Streptomyces hundungensis]|uniref:histidine kinase n=1 Tax=Streptomyces hundungensis TaxID=1077946 RepID=A0A387H972_9ACTN|nr:histidine kinase [Streptomyces hundungensis]AYG79899.1 Sensor histidine kinase DesK [Streptomyces hundungensis]